MPQPAGWYDPDPDYTQYYQGDILRDVPFPTWPTFLTATSTEKWPILRPLKEDGRPINLLPSMLVARAPRDVDEAFLNLERREFVVASCQLRNVIVLTRGCQLDHAKRKHTVVAPVTAIEELDAQERKPEMLDALRAGQIPHKFYLPSIEGLDESFADLLKMTSIHRTFLPNGEVKSKLVARLSSNASYKLQNYLSAHFGQSFGFDQSNECPQDGYYSCSACFYNGREVRKARFRKGMIFGPCPVCGEGAEFVKLPGEG